MDPGWGSRWNGSRSGLISAGGDRLVVETGTGQGDALSQGYQEITFNGVSFGKTFGGSQMSNLDSGWLAGCSL